jgi:Leucine-rich repeat (LRR) protein
MRIFLLIFIATSPCTCINVICEFKPVDFSYIGSAYSCIVQQSLSVTSPDIEITSVRGGHMSDKNDDSVKAFIADDKYIQYIPRNLAKFFKNLLAIKINRGYLVELSPEVFAEMPQLRYLDFDKNSIEILETDLFKFNPRLQRIWLEKNKIKGIDGQLFDGMTALDDVDLSENKCAQKRYNGRITISSLVMQVMGVEIVHY